MKKYLYRMATTLSSIALFVALLADGAKSAIIYHQPQIPKALDKFRKV